MAKQKQGASKKSAKSNSAPKDVRTAAANRTSNKAAQATNSWQSNDILKYASGRDRNADYNNLLTSQNKMGAFDGAAWGRAQAAGYSDTQIRDALEGFRNSKDYANSSLMIGVRPMAVLDNWQGENPETVRAQTMGPVASTSTPSRLVFNPSGGPIGIGRGGNQDQGIGWYTKMGYGEDFSKDPFSTRETMNALENNYYMQTPEGMKRVMDGESPVPTRYIGDKTGAPNQYGGISYGYDKFTSPWAQQYSNNLNYRGSWLNV